MFGNGLAQTANIFIVDYADFIDAKTAVILNFLHEPLAPFIGAKDVIFIDHQMGQRYPACYIPGHLLALNNYREAIDFG